MRVYGKNVVKEYLDKKDVIKKVYIYEKFNDHDILNKLMDVPHKFLSKKELDEMESGNHQGIILEVDDYKYTYIDDLLGDDIVVILDHLEDPHNFGAIIRSSEAFGVDAIIIPNDRSVDITSTVVKTSVGTIEKMKIIKVSNINNAIEKLKKYGYWIVGTDMEGMPYTTIDYKTKIAIVIGNEGKGISDLVSKNCDYLAKIPMVGTVNSLNASVACGIFLAEISRSRGN